MGNNKQVPLISSGVKSRKHGICHLPRFHLKVELNIFGCLAEGYNATGAGGYDGLLLTYFNVDPEAFRDYVRTHKPTPAQLEHWFAAQAGEKRMTPAKIRSFNEKILTYVHSEETAAGIRAFAGKTSSPVNLRNAVKLNDEEDRETVRRINFGLPLDVPWSELPQVIQQVSTAPVPAAAESAKPIVATAHSAPEPEPGTWHQGTESFPEGGIPAGQSASTPQLAASAP